MKKLIIASLLLTGIFSSSLEAETSLERVSKNLKITREDGRELIEISLRDLLVLALEESLTIKRQTLGKQIAKSKLIAQEERNNPTLTTSVSQGKTTSISSAVKANSTKTDSVVANLSKKDDRGITYSTGLTRSKSTTTEYTRDGNTIEKSTKYDSVESLSLSAEIAIPIYKDWGEKINLISVRNARLNLKNSQITEYNTRLQLLKTIGEQYWSVVSNRENIKQLKESIKLSETMIKENKAKVELGILNITELIQSQNQLASTEQSLLQAQIEVQKVEDQIRSALNLDKLPYGLKPSDQPNIHKINQDFKTLIDKVYRTNSNYQAQLISLKQKENQLLEAQNEDATDLDLNLKYKMTGFGENSSESTGTITDTKLAGYSAGITWTVPLGNQKVKEQISQAKLAIIQTQMKLKDLRSQLSVELQTNLRTLRLGKKEISTAKSYADLAKKLLFQEKAKQRQGESTAFLVKQAQEEYDKARKNEIQARAKYEQNYIALLVMTGEIFSHYKLNAN